MVKVRNYIFSFFQLVISFLSVTTDWYFFLSFSLFLVLLLQILDKMGRGVILREIIAVHSAFICLVMPVLGYVLYNETNALSRLWVKSMPVPRDMYFGFALPAISFFALALSWPIANAKSGDEGGALKNLVNASTQLLKKRPKIGVYLVVIGIIMRTVSSFLPVGLQFAFLLFYFAGFAGILYVYYTPSLRYRLIILVVFTSLVLLDAVASGMFTVVAYMGLTLFSFFFLNIYIAFWKKILWFCLGVFVLFIIQGVKPQFRKLTWKDNYAGNKLVLFADLMMSQVTDLNLKSSDAFFPLYIRTNQGFNVAMVMKRVPQIKPFDNGERLFLTFASAFVPRFLWLDKPEAGGRYNMEYYAGYKIIGWSTNVGPLGEAYGSFGVTGGIIFMFALGIFIRWCYKIVFILSSKVPLLIFWIPVLFYQVTYSAETDTLQIMNSLLKSGLFVFILYKLVPELFIPPLKRIFRTKTIFDVPEISIKQGMS